MTRGTTPTYVLTITDFETLAGHTLYVTIEQGCTELTLTGNDLAVEENVITVTLTQEQTLRFKQGNAKLQVRGIDTGGMAYASGIVVVPVNPILKDGVIVHG